MPVSPLPVNKEVQKVRGVVRDFLDFIQERGIVALAIGVVIGSAVNDLVKTIVDGLVTPFIALVSPSTELQSFTFKIGASVFKVGAVLNSLIQFFIVALLVYFAVRTLMREDEKK